jgi:hypothetical protein
MLFTAAKLLSIFLPASQRQKKSFFSELSAPQAKRAVKNILPKKTQISRHRD